MLFKPKKTGINFLCDAIILPQYYNFEREAEFKTNFGNFKNITFENWNFYIAMYFMFAVQRPLQKMDMLKYIKLMERTVDYFETQYPQFRAKFSSLLEIVGEENVSETKVGTWLAANLLQTSANNISIDDINMGCEIADIIVNLGTVIDVKEILSFELL